MTVQRMVQEGELDDKRSIATGRAAQLAINY